MEWADRGIERAIASEGRCVVVVVRQLCCSLGVCRDTHDSTYSHSHTKTGLVLILVLQLDQLDHLRHHQRAVHLRVAASEAQGRPGRAFAAQFPIHRRRSLPRAKQNARRSIASSAAAVPEQVRRPSRHESRPPRTPSARRTPTAGTGRTAGERHREAAAADSHAQQRRRRVRPPTRFPLLVLSHAARTDTRGRLRTAAARWPVSHCWQSSRAR
jgi:hypothetical protein